MARLLATGDRVIPHNLPEALRSRLAIEIAEQSRQLAGGAAADYPDYRERIGVVRGLRKLDEIITELTEDKERK